MILPALGLLWMPIRLLDQASTVTGEHRQHDQDTASGEGRDQWPAESAQNLPIAQRSKRGDKSRDQPNAQYQRQGYVNNQVDLKAAQVGELDSSRGAGDEGKNAVGRQLADKTGDRHQHVSNGR